MNAPVNTKPRGRLFFNNPGPTNIPDRVLRAMDRPVMDFMSDEFVAIHHACHNGVKRVLKTDQGLYMYNASGHGAWEAALANLFSAGDTVLIVETGYFSLSWAEMAENLGIKVETYAADWRKGADVTKLADRLSKDKAHEIKAVLCVHNETATGMVLPIADIRRAMDEAKHPALLLSDTISSLGSMEYKMDAWGADGKGLQLYGQAPDRLSDSVTTVLMPEGVTSDAMRKAALDRFNLSLGGGLGPMAGKVFRIGHLGDLNEPMLLGALATTELAMKTVGVPFSPGVNAAIDSLSS